MDKLMLKYQEYRNDAETEQSPANVAALGLVEQAKQAARSAGLMAPETPSIMSPTGDLGPMPTQQNVDQGKANADTLKLGKGPLKQQPADAPQMRAQTPQESQGMKAAPAAKESYDPSQDSFVGQSIEEGKSQGAQALASTYAGAADFYGTLDSISGIVARKAGMGKPQLFEYLKQSSEYWAEHYQGKVSLDSYMTRVVGGVLGSGPALVEFSLGPAWAALKGYAQDENLIDALYAAGRRTAAGAVFKSAHTLDAAGRIATGTAYMTGENVVEQLGSTGTVDVGQAAEAAGVGAGMMLSGGLGPGNKAGMRHRVNPDAWFESSPQGNEIYKAFGEGRIDAEMKELTKEFYTRDMMRGGTALNDTTMAVVDKLNLLRDGVDDWILAEQGVKKEPGKNYKITGKTTTRHIDKETLSTAIELYEGANAATLVEEWIHRDYDRLSASERGPIQRAYEAYKAGLADGEPQMNQAEFYAKGATDKFFADRVAAQKAANRPAWLKAVESGKQRWDSFVSAVRGVPGAKEDGSAPTISAGQMAEAFTSRESLQVRPVEDIIYDPTPAPSLDRKYAEGGNLNLQRINSDADIAKLIDDVSRHNRETGAFEQATRGTRTWEETAEAAKGDVRVDELLLRKPGEAANDAKMLAARQLQMEFAAQTSELVARFKKTGDVADKDAAVKALGIFTQLTAARDGYAAEWGRTGSIMRRPVGSGEAQLVTKAFADLARKYGGERNADAILDTITDMTRLSADGKLDIEQLSAFTRRLDPASTFDMILEARYIAMLMNPATHIRNTIGNTLALGMQIPERFLAGAIGEFRHRVFTVTDMDRVELGEAAAMMYGAVQGLGAGARAFMKAVRTGESTDPLGKIEVTRRAITAENMGLDPNEPFGKAIDFIAERLRTGNMLMGAEDDFFKAIGYNMEINARAHRAATREGLKGKEFAERVNELVKNPPWDIQLSAMDFSHYTTFTQPVGEGMAKLQAALGTDIPVTLPSGKVIEVPTGKVFRLQIPFFRTPTNLVRFGSERSPFAMFMPSVMQAFADGGAKRDLAIARLTLGSTIGAMAASAAAAGLLTGGGPSDSKQKENLRETGWQPYSFKVGNEWVSYQALEPFSMIIGASADIALFSDYLTDNERNNAAMMVAGAFSQAIVSKTFMQGLDGMLNVLSDPDRYGDKYAQQFAASWVPSPVKAIRRDTDPYLREVQSVADALKNAMPGYSSDLYPRRNRYGEAITMGDVWLSHTVDPMRKSEVKTPENSPTYHIDKEILDNNVPIQRPNRMFNYENSAVELTPEEYDDYQMLPGDLGLVDALNMVIETPEYKAASGGSDGLKSHMIRQVFSDFREQARFEMVERSRGLPGGLAERLELERLDRELKRQEGVQ